MRYRTVLILVLLSQPLINIRPSAVLAACASPEQTAAIKVAAAKMPAALPNVLASRTGIPEAILVTGLDRQTAVGTNGNGFSQIWSSLSGWQRPAFLVPLDKDNMLEVFGRIGSTVTERDGNVLVEVTGAGIGGHFKPASIASIYMVRLPKGAKEMIYGVLFFNAQDETLLGIYSVDSTRPAVLTLLSRDAYQKTWDLIADLPRHCVQ